eukprot:gene3419-4658_t
MAVQVSLNLGWAILNAAGLSFIGLGVSAPTPEWGIMVAEGARFISTGKWWLVAFPGLAQRPNDEAAAMAVASTYLELAREQGDARYAGYAMGALQAWEATPPAQTPPAVLVMRATVAQFLHDFDGAEATLRVALARRPNDAQAWITLATILRVRGRYNESDAACRSLGRTGPAFYGVACLAENAGLRGNHADARQALQALLADPVLRDADKAGTRQWLLTSIAEVEELAGRQAEADAAYRKAVAAQRSGYLLLAYSDYLQRVGRHAEIPKLLANEAR